ncbi:flavin reductase (DIM6/NTAB) family NADH-FMN oxidoreductase RutF [Rhizobium sp. BK312]|uniref:flavin reductase family protein n=1 Tax=Rhizobium sp. BK312 TaxID=2587080 RepID=UPI000DD7D6AA|nr:flavin reductase family protein [Rhizobium sp. BK312]MBB3428165.1 flavin reductase (DIM6/NTAB) family NADH-FMN oxidoreductase RutF [Rhizobium sp. BK312]
MLTNTAEFNAAESDREHIEIKPSVLYVGTPVVLITSLNPDGTTNISPMSSFWALYERVVLGLTSTSKGRENLLRERQLVLNFPSPELWPKVEAIAPTTGRDPVPPHKQKIGYRFEADKFDVAGFTPQPADLVRPLRIAECPIQFEAEVVAAHPPGAEWPPERAEAFSIIEAKVLRVHAHKNIVIGDTNHIDTGRWSPLFYVFRHYFSTGPDLGRTFKAER